jgi:hypothetical protein
MTSLTIGRIYWRKLGGIFPIALYILFRSSRSALSGLRLIPVLLYNYFPILPVYPVFRLIEVDLTEAFFMLEHNVSTEPEGRRI